MISKQVTVTLEGEDPTEVGKWSQVLRLHVERLGFVAQRIHPAAFIIVKEKEKEK